MNFSPARSSLRTFARCLLVWGAVFLGVASTVSRAQTPARVYELNGSYAETNGGSALVPNGGTLGATGYTFALGQGPSISNALTNTGEYSIEVVFRVDAISGYRNLLNFNNLTSDNALYCLSGSALFYSYGSGNSGTADFTVGQTHRMVVTRNATTKIATVYVDGVQKAQVTDSNNYYVASGTNGILHFFRDDGVENTSGFVDQIRIYNAVLTPTQVAALGNASGATGPEIALSGGGNAIPDGDLVPSTAKLTRFGAVDTSLSRTFTIQNSGTAPLTISGIVVSGENASEFAVSGAPTSVAAGASATFNVTYTPTSGVPTSRATITVNNNDSDEAAYDFVVEGEKTAAVGSVWSARSAAAASAWYSVTYGNGQFVAVANSGTSQVMTSPDGSTWTARTAAAASGWYSVAFGNGIFVAVAQTGTPQVMTSPDGITWTARTAAQANRWRSVTYGNGLFVAVSEDGTGRVMTSPDGVTWTARAAAQTNLWLSVAYGNGRFVAVAYNGTNRVMTSTDGINWTAATTTLAAGTWRSVTYGNGIFVAVSDSGAQRAATSVDGITWTAQSSPPASAWVSVAYGAGMFVATAESGTNRVMTSADGVTWTAGNSVSQSVWYSVAYGKERFVSVSLDATDRVMVATGPEINVRGLGVSIPDGSTAPSTADGSQFGQNAGAFARTFIIENIGGAALSVSSVTVSGEGAGSFAISGAPSSVAAGSNASFVVIFTPTPGVVSRATITVASNDSDEAAYDFAIEGSATAPTVTSVQPSEGTTAGGTSLTIAGTGFGGNATVTVGGAAATSVNVFSPTLLTCVAPAGTAGARSVVVTTAVGSSPANSLYTYVTTTPGGVQALNASIVGSHVLACVVQPDGKIVIAGQFTQVLGVTRNRIARLNADGTLDTAFDPNAGWEVSSLQLQPDGKILVGGSFQSFQPNGAGSATTRNRIARLNSDGSLDASFNPNANNVVNALCLQPDGKILVGGIFTALQPNGAASPTTCTRLARLNSDGSLDATFSPGVDSDVFGLSVAADGRILVGGAFLNVQSTGSGTSSAWSYLARLSSTGVLDTGFLPKPNNKVWSLLVQPDGKIVLGGEFTALQPNGAAVATTRNRIARINTDGTLDPTFAPTAGGIVFTLGLQADGKILGGGNAGVTRWSATGVVDSSFNPAPNGTVYSLVHQADGRVLLGGTFTAVGGVARSYLARVNNDVATNTLSVPNVTQVVWLRGGGAPELAQVSIEQSTNGGASWTSLGTPVRVAGTANWQITGLNLASGLQLRARGRASGGYFNASSSYVEQVAGFTNAQPADIGLSATSIAENNAANAAVGTLTTTDANTGDLFTYALVGGAGSADNASFTISGDTLRLTPVADFETKSSYAVRVRSTDAGGQFFEKALTVTITNVNEVPSFTKGADVVVPHSTTTAQTVNGWATAINDGDSTVTQALTFNVTVTSGANLFTTAPAISSAGVLTFQPNGIAGIATVLVTLTDDATAGTAALTTAAQTFTITMPAPPLVPFLGSISPTSGASAGGTTVTITGNNFGTVTGVSFGGAPAASFTINSATSITAVTPAGTPGVANVTVTTSGGTSATNPLFTYFAPTTTTLTSSQNPSVFLAGSTFTARAVSAQAGLTGQMALFVDDVLFQSKAVDAGGFATFAPGADVLRSGTRVLRAVYNADGAVATFGTSSATLNQVVNRATLPITLTGLAQTYDGTPKPVGATVTIPPGFTATVALTYAGSSAAPTAAGSYPVVATLDHPEFVGSAAGTLVVSPAAVGIAFIDTLQAYDGTPRVAGIATFPAGIPAALTYQPLVNGVPAGSVTSTAPVAAGRYRLAAVNTNANYAFASTTGELYVTKRGVSISLAGLYAVADGQPKPVTVTTVPAGVAVNVTYAAGAVTTTTAPSLPPPGGGVWRVDATVVDTVSNLGSASGDLRIDNRAPAPITLTGPATANPYDFAVLGASVRPIRKGVAPTGTVIFKQGGVEFYRGTPTAKGDVYVRPPPLAVRAQPYSITAEYTGDENYLPNSAAPLSLTMAKKVVQLPDREETKTYDGRLFGVSYRGRVFEGYSVNDALVTYNGDRFGPKDATARMAVNIVAPLNGPDLEVRETVYLTIARRPASIRLANMQQTIRPSLNHKPDVIVEPAGAPFLISFNGTTLTPAQLRIDNPGTYAVRAWISDPNYEPAETTGTFSLTLAPVAITISNLNQIYDGGGKSVTVTTNPPMGYNVAYNDSNQPPTAPGYYTVKVTPIASGYGPGNTATMTIASRIGATSRDGDDSVGMGGFELRNASGDIVATSFPANVVPDASFGSSSYSYGTLTYVPVDGAFTRSRFSYWEGVAGYAKNYNPLQISFSTPQPPGAYNYTARYVVENLIVPTAEGNGTVSGGDWFKAGDVARFTATPAAGHIVERWLYNGQTVGTSAEALIKIAKNGGNPKAVFVPGYFAIARAHPWYDKVGMASFIRTSQPALPALSAGYVPLASSFTATAVPKPGFVFDFWELINAQPASPFDSLNSSTVTFRPIDPSKQAIAHAHFLEQTPTMDILAGPFVRRDPPPLLTASIVEFELLINNSRAAAKNVRIKLIESTGYRVTLSKNDTFWNYYYPHPRDQSEIAANSASNLTPTQKTILTQLGPINWSTSTIFLKSDLGDIPAKTRKIFTGLRMPSWAEGMLIGNGNMEQVRIAIHIEADGFAKTYEDWYPLAVF